MPFVQLNSGAQWGKLARRILVSGPPNSGKTYCVRTIPGHIAYIAYPGEGGSSTLNQKEIESKGGKCWVWENPPAGTPMDYGKVCNEIRTLTVEILAGKHGAFDAFVGDGLHKLYGMFLADQTNGASEAGEDFEAKLYGGSHKRFFAYLRMVRDSQMPLVLFTVWDGREKDDPDAKDRDTEKHIFPELPGKAAKDIMGEVSVAVYATIKTIGTERKYQWQTKPMNKVWGCGIKLPEEKKIVVPLFVPQDVAALVNLLDPPVVADKKEVVA